MNYDFEESGKRDHVNINDFDVLNRISSIINSEFGSNDAAIARYLIAHIRRSSEINVAAITRDAFVTRSAVRRFCNRLGYQSLSDFERIIYSVSLSKRLKPSRGGIWLRGVQGRARRSHDRDVR